MAYYTLLSIVPMFALILLLGAQVIAAYERIGMRDDEEGLRT